MTQRGESRTWLWVALLVILGLIVGLGVGLLFGWVVVPVEYVDTAIADLRVDYKEEYILMVASAYACDGDLDKAQARLELLEAPNVGQWISDMVDRAIGEGRDEADVRALATLAHGLGVSSPQMVAYLATATPLPTDTPLPTATPAPTDTPTATPVPPTEAPTDIPLTEAPLPTDAPPPTAAPTDVPPTEAPPPTNTPLPPTDTPPPPPPTNTPKPKPTNTPKPPPTNTPKPQPPAAKWSVIEQRLVGPGQDGQGCTYGNLQIRVTVVDANGAQLGGVWVYDKYSQQYQLTGNVDSPEWGPGETKFEYGIGGGGSLCIAQGQGGPCVSGWTRDMPCYYVPPADDLFSAGYCSQCCEPDASLDRCRQLVDEGKCMGNGHYSWRVVFKRNF
jgi:hypothetical protein